MTMETAYEILGAQIVNEVTGIPPVVGAGPGLDPQFGINAAAELISRGISTHQAKEEAKQKSAATAAQLERAIAADVAWANAEVMLETASASKDPQKIAAAQSLASSSQSAAAIVGIGLAPEASAQRITKAQDTAKKAAEASYADPKNLGKAAAMRAWQKVASAVVTSTAQAPGGEQALQLANVGGTSFLDVMRRRYGGVPVWGWAVGGLGLTFGLTLFIRALRKRR